jgi:hypothetical protein
MSVLGGMGLQLAVPAPDVTFTMSQLESNLNVGRSQSEPTEQMQKVNPAMDRLLGVLLPTMLSRRRRVQCSMYCIGGTNSCPDTAYQHCSEGFSKLAILTLVLCDGCIHLTHSNYRRVHTCNAVYLPALTAHGCEFGGQAE